jgi:signal transduction histidine kinase/DNA-binding response OmpR family regulator
VPDTRPQGTFSNGVSPQGPERALRFPTQLCAITLALTLATFGWVVWNAYATYRDADIYRSRDLRIEELRGIILRLDEVLTMSARMAAATGDLRWEARYRGSEPTLDAAIKETMAAAPGDAAIAGSAQTDVANAKLVAMENEAFALVRAGRAEDARAVLFAQAYEDQKAVYAEGMTSVLTDVRAHVDSSVRQAERRTRLSTSGSVVLLGLSIGAWVAVIVKLRSQGAERRQIQAALVEARDAALAASRQKAEFLANMSHEIRTPMNGVLGMTALALDSELTAEQRDCLTTVQSSAQSLLAILNDILDFSKIEAGKLEIEAIPFSVVTLAKDLLKTLSFKADEKGLELLSDLDPEIPAAVVGDPVRVRQVLANLLANAIKFTETGHVLLEIRAEARGDGSTTLHFLVSDTGIGIAPEKHATIFEAFSQADGSMTRQFGGTGLGLTISATLVRLMAGRIWVESAAGAGSVFHFTASFATAAQPETVARELPLPPLSILIVDDNAVNRRILQAQVTRWGLIPTAVATGAAALEALAGAASGGHPFRLVLLDANMPVRDGFWVAEQIAARPELASPTIMMLTSSGQFGDAARCRELGVAAYLTKPIHAATLRDAVCHLLRQPATTRTATALAAPSPAIAAAPPARRLDILLAEDNAVNQTLAVTLLTRRGHTVTVANDGREALAALEHAQFDLVLMDVQMPEMGGFEATVAIRRREQGTGQRVRIVAMTAHVMTGDRERCAAAGMDGYLAKPIDAGVLFALVEEPVVTRWPAHLQTGAAVTAGLRGV